MNDAYNNAGRVEKPQLINSREQVLDGHRRIRRGPTRFRGIGDAAEQLGVNPSHLWRVLTGERPSRRLTLAYEELKGNKGEAL